MLSEHSARCDIKTFESVNLGFFMILIIIYSLSSGQGRDSGEWVHNYLIFTIDIFSLEGLSPLVYYR